MFLRFPNSALSNNIYQYKSSGPVDFGFQIFGSNDALIDSEIESFYDMPDDAMPRNELLGCANIP